MDKIVSVLLRKQFATSLEKLCNKPNIGKPALIATTVSLLDKSICSEIRFGMTMNSNKNGDFRVTADYCIETLPILKKSDL